MTAEQKQRALTALGMWHSSNDSSQREYQAAELMAALLQELVDAPEAEPVARVTGYYAGYLSISTIDGRVLPACTALYLAPPAPSVPDGWKLVPYTPTEEMLEQAAYAVNSRPKPSKYEATATPSIIFWNAMLKYSPESTGIKEPPADLVRDVRLQVESEFAALLPGVTYMDAPEAEPVLVVETEPGYWTRGHYCEGTKSYIDPTKVWGLPAGTKLYTAPPAPSVPNRWRSLTDVEWMNIVNFDRAYSSYDKEEAVNEAVKRTEAKLKELNAAPTPAEAPADVARDAKPDIWRVMCGDWRDKTVAIHNSAGYITCGLDPAKAAVLVRAHNGEMSDGGAAIAEVKGQS